MSSGLFEPPPAEPVQKRLRAEVAELSRLFHQALPDVAAYAAEKQSAQIGAKR